MSAQAVSSLGRAVGVILVLCFASPSWKLARADDQIHDNSTVPPDAAPPPQFSPPPPPVFRASDVVGNVLRSAMSRGPTVNVPQVWNCEEAWPAMMDLQMHIVVSTNYPDAVMLSSWMSGLGMTGAQVFVYYRTQPPAGSIPPINLPCNMSLTWIHLAPNRGRESAVYFYHIAQHYHHLPDITVLLHSHGPAAWHSLCGPFYRRLRAVYRGLHPANKVQVFRDFAKTLVTLNSGCQQFHLPAHGCCRASVCAHVQQPELCPFTGSDCEAPEGSQFLKESFYYYRPHENELLVQQQRSYTAVLSGYRESVHGEQDYPSWETPPDVAKEYYRRYTELCGKYNLSSSITRVLGCCLQVAMPRARLLRVPRAFYLDALALTAGYPDAVATKLAEFIGWRAWHDDKWTSDDILLYLKVEDAVKAAGEHYRGCPGVAITLPPPAPPPPAPPLPPSPPPQPEPPPPSPDSQQPHGNSSSTGSSSSGNHMAGVAPPLRAMPHQEWSLTERSRFGNADGFGDAGGVHDLSAHGIMVLANASSSIQEALAAEAAARLARRSRRGHFRSRLAGGLPKALGNGTG